MRIQDQLQCAGQACEEDEGTQAQFKRTRQARREDEQVQV